MNKVYKRVAAWNAARYDREFNTELTCNLLREEHQEFFDAATPADKLDALCDIVYVAMGGIWKMGLVEDNDDTLSAKAAAHLLLQTHTFDPIMLISATIDTIQYDPDVSQSCMLALVIEFAMVQMYGMGLKHEQAVQALNIVCDANDTKSVAKVASDVKANIDKGPNFVPPEVKLAELLKEISDATYH